MQQKKSISKIVVEKLFGLYSYSLVSNPNTNFLILYGDNGSGKTTILNILQHLLNPEPFGGHRSYIGKIPFLRFIVTLSNNSEIRVERKDIDCHDFSIFFPYKNGTLEYRWKEEDNERRIKKENYDSFCSFLSDLRMNTIIVSADRRIYEEDENERPFFIRRRSGREEVFEESEKRTSTLKDVIDGFNRWMHYYVFTLTNEGNQSIDEHYLNIIQNYTQSNGMSWVEIKQKLNEIKERNKAFIDFGLSVDLFSGKFQKIVGSLNENELDKVGPALDSYLGSLELRLNALQPLLDKLQVFKSYISKMFKDKGIIINAYDGVKITNYKGTDLDFQKLSSGEKQVLYLFCRIISSSEKSLLVLIDEPEISLNIKWQRLFLKAVEQLIGSNDIQVVIASHSIELITPYANSVARLESK